MTLCPIALLIGCQKCPVVAICLVKGFIGDYQKPAASHPKPHPGKKPTGEKPAK